MENGNNIIKSAKGWKIAVICLAAALVVMCGLFAFFAIKSSNERITLQNTITSLQNKQEQEPEPDTAPNEPEPESEQNSDRYLVIEEWGLRLKIPTEFTELTYESEGLDDTIMSINGKFKPSHGGDEVLVETSFLRYRQDNDPMRNCNGGCFPNVLYHDDYIFYFNPHLPSVVNHAL
ncbi:MAG: hypothetical protein FWH42_06325 [Dehalococcoidia bacterium]|nr:hypothetical protein [Dehalococcoidia bacterium]